MPALSVPEPLPNDSEDLSTALETAAIFGAQGDVREAVRWVRRAAELAGDAGDDMRALALARAVADLGASVAPSPPAAAAPAPAVEAPALPPPPPLPDRSAAAALADGDRVTSPGIAPPSYPPPAPSAEASAEAAPAVSSRPHSASPPTANEDAGWSQSDHEDEPTGVTNGAAAAPPAPAPAAVAPAAPALAPAAAAPAPAPAAPAPAPAVAAQSVTIPLHQAARVRVEGTTEAGVFRVTLLAAGESAGAEADEAVLVLLDPRARLDS